MPAVGGTIALGLGAVNRYMREAQDPAPTAGGSFGSKTWDNKSLARGAGFSVVKAGPPSLSALDSELVHASPGQLGVQG